MIGEDKTFTLSTMQQDTVCYPINMMVATRGGKDDMRTTFGVGEQDDPQFTISAAHCHAVCYSVENHPNDSRVKIREDGTVQTLSARCGTGGGNTPCALICCDSIRRIQGNAPDPESVRR